MGHTPLPYLPPSLWPVALRDGTHTPTIPSPPLCGLWLCVMGHTPLPYLPPSLWPVAPCDGTHTPTIPAPLSVACGSV